MSFNVKKVGVFSRRVFVLSLLKILTFFLIFGRLLHLQVLSHRKYLEKSTNNRTKSFIIPSPRGLILDYQNTELAFNGKYWQVIIKNQKKDFETIKKTLTLLEVDEDFLRYVLKEYKKTPFEEFTVYEFLTEKQLTAIELNISNLPNVHVVEGLARYYIHKLAYSNLIGYVSTPTVEDLQSGKSKHPDIKIGSSGIEKSLNEQLTGVAGKRIFEVDAFGHKIQNISTLEPESGKNVTLTLNHKIQSLMFELTNGRRMSSALINVKDGSILGMVSSPSFDAETLSQKISNKQWVDIVNDPQKPMLNRAFQSSYSPGSVFKIIASIAALERGFNSKKQFYCNGTYKVGRKTLHCWKKGGHGMMNLETAIQHSCNVYFYNLADYINVDDIYGVAQRLGFAQTFNRFELLGQKEGFVPASHLVSYFSKGDLINTIIGQGAITCTTLQIAVMIARLSTGKMIVPHLTSSNLKIADLDIAQEDRETVLLGLFKAGNERGGTSYYGRITERGLEFAGKTGTAQVISKFVAKGEGYESEFHKPHGLFAGFAPYDKPRFAIATVCENAGYGSTSALPFSSSVLHYAQKLFSGKESEAELLKKRIIKRFL